MSSILFFTSTRGFEAPVTTQRILDTLQVLSARGYHIDVITPRVTIPLPMLSDVSFFELPVIPFCSDLPQRSFFRRLLLLILMFLKGLSIASRNTYVVMHGVDDGGLVARTVNRILISPIPYVFEALHPFTLPRHARQARGLRRRIATHFERSAAKHADVVVVTSPTTPRLFPADVPQSRFSIIPVLDATANGYTFNDFRHALLGCYDYISTQTASDYFNETEDETK